jgi:hypothetical protein
VLFFESVKNLVILSIRRLFDKIEKSSLNSKVTRKLTISIFWSEFSFNLIKSKKKSQFIKRSWADIIGMIPVTEVSLRFVRVFRLFRIFRIARIGRITRITKATKLTKLTKTSKIAKGEKAGRYMRRFLKKISSLIKRK